MEKVFLIASFGGHWQQLNIIVDALRLDMSEFEMVYCTTKKPERVNGECFTVQDSNFNEKLKLFKMTVQLTLIIFKNRPDVIVTTGAAPGLVALFLCWMLRVKKRVWIDSIANAGQLSKSGRYARYFATNWYTQWEELSGKENNMPDFLGSII